jgi:hypothetical protein
MNTSYSTSDSDSDEELSDSIHFIRKSLIKIYEQLNAGISDMNAFSEKMNKPNAKTILEPLLQKAIASGVKGIAIYDFLICSLV